MTFLDRTVWGSALDTFLSQNNFPTCENNFFTSPNNFPTCQNNFCTSQKIFGHFFVTDRQSDRQTDRQTHRTLLLYIDYPKWKLGSSFKLIFPSCIFGVFLGYSRGIFRNFEREKFRAEASLGEKFKCSFASCLYTVESQG